jgi:hypothetical protein
MVNILMFYEYGAFFKRTVILIFEVGNVPYFMENIMNVEKRKIVTWLKLSK